MKEVFTAHTCDLSEMFSLGDYTALNGKYYVSMIMEGREDMRLVHFLRPWSALKISVKIFLMSLQGLIFKA